MSRVGLTEAFTRFQFQLGAIGRLGTWASAASTVMFQFQLGAIGSQAAPQLNVSYWSFNSSLVRLGVYAIGKSIDKICVSIPAWCDWEYPYWNGFLNLFSVSIPAWCDWEEYITDCYYGSDEVSIPAWCDWEKKC